MSPGHRPDEFFSDAVCYSVWRVSQEVVEQLLPVVHFYNIGHVLRACLKLLTSMQLSGELSSPAYALKWLEVAERLQLDDQLAKR